MAIKNSKGKGFDLLLSEDNKLKETHLSDSKELTKLHCDIEKELKKRVEMFKVKSDMSIKEIVHLALDEYLKKYFN